MAFVMSEIEPTKIHTPYSDMEVDQICNESTSFQSHFTDSSAPKNIKQEINDGRSASGASTPSSSSYEKGSSIKDAPFAAPSPSTSIKVSTPAITIAGQISNAGRKKSNPAWDFFVDLRPQGTNAVKCRFCDFVSEDRSPSAMRLHIRKTHDTGINGLWYQLEQKTLQQVPHKYTKSREAMAVRKKDSDYDEAIIAAAKAFLLQSTGSGAADLSVLTQNLQSLHEVAGNNDPETPQSSDLAVKNEEPDFEDGDDSMPTFEIHGDGQEVGEPGPSALNVLSQEIKATIKPSNPRMNNWVHLGSFTNEADMLAVRAKEKVSKRRTEQLKNGVKVRYRCNRWKKTKCAFQMYSFYWPEGKIDLYESGTHDHTGKNLGLVVNQKKPTPPMNPVPMRLTQEEILNNLLQQLNSGNSQAEVVNVGTSNIDEAPVQEEPPTKMPRLESAASFTENFNSLNVNQAGISSVPALLAVLQSQNGIPMVAPQTSKTDYILANGDSIANLLEIATELELVFTFNSRNTAEYCFQSNVDSLKDRMVVLIDLGSQVQVSERVNNQSTKDERWSKGDWKQFLWAVRGKCLTFLKETPKKPARPFNINSLM